MLLIRIIQRIGPTVGLSVPKALMPLQPERYKAILELSRHGRRRHVMHIASGLCHVTGC